MRDVEAMTNVATSQTTQTTSQTIESQYPLHILDISKERHDTLSDLAAVIMAWPKLPDSMRKGIIAMVQSVTL